MKLPILRSSCPHNAAPDPARTVSLTMWETSRLSEAAVACCNALRALIIPADSVAEWFRDSGVTTPIRVVPLGIDVGTFNPASPPGIGAGGGVATFGCAGRTAHGGVRKGLDDVIAAFLDAFPDDQSVRLEVKIWPDCEVVDCGDERVKLVRDPLSEVDLAAWYRSLAVFVSASRGEGWGLQPHQAMACGTLCIGPFWGGHAAYMTPESCYAVEYDERPAIGPIYGGLGNWCVPRHASIVEQMRRAHADADERRRKGAAAAARAAEFPWSRTAAGVRDVLVEFAL